MKSFNLAWNTNLRKLNYYNKLFNVKGCISNEAYYSRANDVGRSYASEVISY